MIFADGAVLSQMQDGEDRVLAYGSRRLSSTEQNYCTTRRELLAVVELTTHLRQYLLRRLFIVHIYHSSLWCLIRMKEPEGQLARWLEKHNFKVIHRPGRRYENADVLSKRPCRQTSPCTIQDPTQKNDCFRQPEVQYDLGLSIADYVLEANLWSSAQ
jgi:hypothetical protein